MKSWFTIGLVLVIAAWSCTSDAEKKAAEKRRLESEAELRVQEYIAVLQKNCRDKVLVEAVRVADSVLLVEARLSADTVLKPFKIPRPEKPETQILPDTIPVRPFLRPKKDSVKQ
jgi:hypothetical protein